MTILPEHTPMSVEEYLELDRNSSDARYEYIDGYVTMLAGGTIDHSTISANVISLLRGSLRGRPCRVLTADARVYISRSRYVYPDITVSCDERDSGKLDIVKFPHLIVEVLSPTTEAYDRGKKFTYYRTRPTLQEYMLVNTAYPTVEIFRRQRNNDLWTLQIFNLDNNVELQHLDLRFPVADVYEDIIFSETPQDDDEL